MGTLINIEEIIAYNSENQTLEFKEVQYPLGNHYKKHELLKDISAMANHPSDDDKYIIIGVVEENGQAVGFKSIQQITDEANYQQFINEYIEPAINFEYTIFNHKGNSLAYFRIYDNKDRPYLFKKDFRNSVDKKKIEYREGDGFLRKGTTIKKITREDLEVIYRRKFLIPDRKSDIDVSVSLTNTENPILSKYNLKCLDVSVQNKSNKSIAFDIDLIIEKTKNLRILTGFDIRRAIKMSKQNKNIEGGLYNFKMPSLNTAFIFSNVNISESENQILVRKTKLRMESNAVTIPQEESEDSIFNNEIIILFEGEDAIKGKVVLRSDDFTEGALIKPFEFSV